MSDAENASTPNSKGIINLPAMSVETWELIEHRLMGKIRTYIIGVLTLIVAVSSIIGFAGYLGIPTYIQSQFRDKIEQDVKMSDKLRENIKQTQENIFADEKIFIVLLERYMRDERTLFNLATRAIEELKRSETLTATDISEFRKRFIHVIHDITKQELSPLEYKKLREEISKHYTDIYKIDEVREMFWIYPHVWALRNTLRRSIDRFVVKETTDEEAKIVLFKEYEISFYSTYRKEFDLFGEDTFAHVSSNWSTLFPSADRLFLSLDRYNNEFERWRETRQSHDRQPPAGRDN
jgi:hypothetical protein